MNKHGLLVLGFGNHFVKCHLPIIIANSQLKIVAIGEVLEEHKDQVLEQLSIHGLDAPISTVPQSSPPQDTSCCEKLIKKYANQLSAAVVSLPHSKHYFNAKSCLENALHILVDKPLTINYENAQELTNLAHNNNCILVVGSQRRYELTFESAKKVIKTGKIGKLLQINGTISAPYDHLNGWWSNSVLAGQGVVLWNLAWHLVDTIVYLLECKAQFVSAKFISARHQDDGVSALIRFENGTDAVITANIIAPLNSVYERIQLWGTEGMLVIDRFKPTYDNLPAKVTFQKINGSLVYEDLSNAQAKGGAPTDAFIRAITDDRKNGYSNTMNRVVSSGFESLETVRILESMFNSSQRSNCIEFENHD